MGIALITVGGLSAIANVFFLFWVVTNLNNFSQVYQKAFGATPSWVSSSWFFVILFLFIDAAVILFGQHLMKHKAQEKKFQILSIALIVLVIVIISSLQAFLGFALNTSVFNLGAI